MCGIFGYVNSKNGLKKTLKAMNKISYRGKDARGIYYNNKITITTSKDKNLIEEIEKNSIKDKSTNDKNLKSDNQNQIILGHLLHSIVNFLPQPITNTKNKQKNILIANCEIYNWEELNKKYKIETKNDVETLLYLLEKNQQTQQTASSLKQNKILELLDELDGTYAFAYLNASQSEPELILTRDRLGVKPLWYYYNEKTGEFNFASEKKVLNQKKEESSNPPKELNPREILIYNIKTKKITFIQKKFTFEMYEKEITFAYSQIKNETKKLLIDAIKKRIPKNQKLGLLFSGGIDSTFIAYVLKQLKVDFTCYTAKVEGGNIEEAQDIIYAKEIAKKYDLKLKIAKIHIEKLEKEIKIVKQLIETDQYLKISIAMPFYLACKHAKKDKIKVMFSGLGSEEIFAGYKRHRDVENINLECFKGLLCLHERDLYRDDIITMKNSMEMRLPFLDKPLVDYTIKIPDKYKLSKDKLKSKIILREIASEMGLDEKYSQRAKQAAQYGSKFDKGLQKLAKNNNLNKQEYVKNL